MKKRNIVPLIFVLATIVFEILPYGAKLTFGLDGGETQEKLFSYFSLTPFGYANFLPLIISVLTCVLLVLSVLVLIKNCEKCEKAFKILVIGVFVLSSVSFFVFNYTLTASFISFTISLSWLSAQLIYKA